MENNKVEVSISCNGNPNLIFVVVRSLVNLYYDLLIFMRHIRFAIIKVADLDVLKSINLENNANHSHQLIYLIIP